MSITAYINKLGPIADEEMEFRPIMVFTGESGVGKSYTAMLWYNLMTALGDARLTHFCEQKWNLKISDTSAADNETYAFKLKDLRRWLNSITPAYIGYLLGDTQFGCDVNYSLGMDDEKTVTISIQTGKYERLATYTIEDTKYIMPADDISKAYILAHCLSRHFRKRLFDKDSMSPLFLPPARAALMGSGTASSSIGMYREFLSQFTDLKTPSQKPNEDNQFFASCIAKLSDGSIVTTDGSVSLRFADGNTIPISAAASSVKELMPFLLMIQNGKQIANYSMLFEEPEAHVHPKKQYLVMDMLARCANKGMFVQMTTHSDYLLSRMNQLIRLGNIKKASEKAFDDYCQANKHNRKLYVDAEKVGAYYFKRDGANVKIIRQDTAHGLPFTTFDEIVRQQMLNSTNIEEAGEAAGIDTTI